MRSLLNELDVLKVIDEQVPARMTGEWIKADKLAKSVIVDYLSDSFLGFAKTYDTAKQVLQSLDAIYEWESLATQLAIRKKLLGFKLQGDTSLIKHFTTFDDLITELSAAGAQLEETDKVSHLLLALPAVYDGIITAIETLSEDNLTLAFVKTQLLDHEVKLRTESKDTSVKVLQAVHEDTAANIKKNNFKNPKFRGHFNKNNNNKKKFKSKKKNFGILKCHHCGRKNHLIKDCIFYKRNQQYAAERNRTKPKIETNQATTSYSDTSNFAFMAGNHQHDNNSNRIIFPLDSGASDHLINSDAFYSSSIILNSTIKISVAKNGTFITATKRGVINITSDMGIPGVLEDVLYCPDGPHNLLSVRKMQQAKMSIILNPYGVEISKNSRIIMTGKPLNNNLILIEYFIDTSRISNKRVFSTTSNSYQLWHQRLGHMGRSKFLESKNKEMVNDIDLINNIIPNDNICEVCIFGKQARLPFQKSKVKYYIKRPLVF